MFAQNMTQEDGSIVDNQIDEENAFYHMFIIDSMKIVNRENSQIKYEISLVSCNWYNCISNIHFSDNDKYPESVFDILKACMLEANLKVNDTFKDVKTDVKMNYISQANDNLFKIFNHLMDKLYFFSKKDDKLKFLVYCQHSGEYGLLDIADKNTFMGMTTTVLSFFKSNAEHLVQENESNIGSYSNGKMKRDLYMTMFNKSICEYDFQKNDLVIDDSANEKALVNFMNEHVAYDDYQLKYHELALDKALTYVKNASYWNDPLDVYFNMIESMYSTGSLTLNTSGEILRQCGFAVTLVIDRDINALTDDSSQNMEDLKTKYIGFEGTWIALKVVNVICPSRNMFRQKIALFRNYTKRDSESFETVL